MSGIIIATALWLSAQAPAVELVDMQSVDQRFLFDIKYATADNFTGQVLYPAARCLLRPEVAKMVAGAQAFLDAKHPGLRLMFKDCYRPHTIQKKLWEVVVGTPQQSYVANPNRSGSVHSFAAAVDLTLADAEGKELDMGTPYDHLGSLAQPRYEERFLKEGKLTPAQVANRRILREAMVSGGGFKMIRNEWWHFDAWRGRALRERFQRLDQPLQP